jgi:hypothetical protein
MIELTLNVNPGDSLSLDVKRSGSDGFLNLPDPADPCGDNGPHAFARRHPSAKKQGQCYRSIIERDSYD